MSTISVGTSGYTYHEWVGPLYPEGLAPAEYLPYYAAHFSTLELNSTRYRMPTAAKLAHLHQQAPSLRFSIKAHRSFTTEIASSWRSAVAAFSAAVQPLLHAGVLQAILLQFPASFVYAPAERRYLDSLLKCLSHLPLAVEFHHSLWYNNRTLDGLRQRKVSFVSLDLPAVDGVPPLLDTTTADLAYLRLHGRNATTWWASDVASRYDYWYSTEELKQIAQRIRLLALESKQTLVYCNNHPKGAAVANARTLATLLESDDG
ncbi:MAG TPA: DUF72 domain-containing protein [Sphaerochaeta sp.]|nr:DUF72 domain-containing protein [Sphaerochaeta sp.]